MVTIYDIAKACSCSSATVSKVFNNVGNISEGKRKEILAAAEKMGYVPNVTARNLVKKRSNMVGVLLFVDESLGLRHEMFAETLNIFRTQMEKNGYEIVLISEKGSQWEGKFLDHCRALRFGCFCNGTVFRRSFGRLVPERESDAGSCICHRIDRARQKMVWRDDRLCRGRSEQRDDRHCGFRHGYDSVRGICV